MLKKIGRVPVRRLWRYASSVRLRDTDKSIGKCNVIFFSHDVDRGTKLEGQPFSSLLDNLSYSLRKQGLLTSHISFFGSKQTSIFDLTPAFLINRKYLWASIVDTLRFLRARVRKGDVPTSSRVELLFKDLIQKSEARLIVTIGLPKALAIAASKAEVHVIEVLHGFGYHPLPWDYGTRNEAELASEFWVADALSLATFLPLEAKGVVVTLINPLQLAKLPPVSANLSKADLGVSPEQHCSSPHQSEKLAKKVLFASSRGGYFGGRIDGRVADWGLVEKLIEESTESVQWYFRIHPMQVAEGSLSLEFRNISKIVRRYSNCDWEWATTSPPSAVYHEMDCLVTWGSEAVFDAHFSGLNSAVILPPHVDSGQAEGNHKTFDFLAEKKTLFFIPPDVSNILEWVAGQSPVEAELRAETGAHDLGFLVSRCLKLSGEDRAGTQGT